MKTALLSALLLGLVGCAASSDPSDGASSSAADTAAPRNAPLMCVVTADHPFNGDGDVWTVSDTVVMKTTAFYWHGEPMVQDDATGSTWLINARDPSMISATNADLDSVVFDLVADPSIPSLYTVTIEESGLPKVDTYARNCIMTPAASSSP